MLLQAANVLEAAQAPLLWLASEKTILDDNNLLRRVEPGQGGSS